MLVGEEQNGKRIGRKIKWDPEKEVIIDDDQTSQLLSRPYRAPWELG